MNILVVFHDFWLLYENLGANIIPICKWRDQSSTKLKTESTNRVFLNLELIVRREIVLLLDEIESTDEGLACA